jgi:3-mercaptopyruvate sulfurtransferase SseA
VKNGGLTNVAALKGGWDAWRNSGAPVETGLTVPKQQ